MKIETQQQTNYESSAVKIDNSTMLQGQKCLRAQAAIPKYIVIFSFHGEVSSERTRTSIQVAENYHIEAGDFGVYTNHSCDPNAAISAHFNAETLCATVKLVTLRKVRAGEELTFDYATTESTLTSELLNKLCLCNSSQCRKIMLGFNQLTDIQKDKLIEEDVVADYLYAT
ncbi:MAG: SET domain-containing protein-lysine N-methyltransferase [Bacteroidales bacterium]|jgi:hypothetical protein|nr:SET domain-containing protein-lysine N-methyltransferase [Bacteroidales bacterium]